MFRLLRVCFICVLASSATVSQEVWVCQYVFFFQYVLVLSLKFGLPLLGQLILARHTLEIRHFRLLYSIQSIHLYTPAISWSFNFLHSPYHLYHQDLIHAVRYCRYTVYIGFIRPLASKMPMFVPRSYSSSDFGFKSKPLWLQWQVLALQCCPGSALEFEYPPCCWDTPGASLSSKDMLTTLPVPLAKQDRTIFNWDTHPAFASLTRFWSGVSKNSSSSQLNKISKRSQAVKGGQVKRLMLPAVLFCGVHRLSVQTLQDASTQKKMHTLWIFIMPCEQNS